VNLSVDALLECRQELAKRWLLALLARRPLARAAEMPLRSASEDSPALCALLLEATTSDAGLQRLDASAAPVDGRPAALALALVRLADTPEPAGVVAVVEELRRVLWAALAPALSELGAGRAGEVGDRLSHVCSVLTAAAVQAAVADVAPTDTAAAVSPNRAIVLATDSAQPAVDSVAPSKPSHDQSPYPQPPQDELADGARPDSAPADGTPGAPHDPVAGPARSRDAYPRIDVHENGSSGDAAGPGDAWTIADGSATLGEPDLGDPDELRISAGPGRSRDAWAQPPTDQPTDQSTDQSTERAVASSPFAVLLIELVGVNRLRQADPGDETGELLDAVHEALRAALRPLDLLEREAPGRWWLLAPAASLAHGRVLAERLAKTVRTSVTDRHGPLEVAIGLAACPDHGSGAQELGQRAEEELYAARAAGVSVMPGVTSALSGS
jgi:GGDEF domain-containing protein